MFKVRAASVEDLMLAQFAGQANERPTEVLISADDRPFPAAPPRIDIRKRYHKEWISRSRKPRNAWRFK